MKNPSSNSTAQPLIIAVKANTVYVCPPQTLLDLKNGFVSIANELDDERPLSPSRGAKGLTSRLVPSPLFAVGSLQGVNE